MFQKAIQRINSFGTTPHLFFQDKRVYKSSSGLYFTILFGICFCISLWVYGKDLIFRENPQTTISEISVKHPKRFNITQDTFNFAFGIQDKNYQPFYDPSIMTIDIREKIIRSVKYENGTTSLLHEDYDLVPRPCQKKDFMVDTEYFHNIYGLNNYICISNYTNIEGDYGGDIYADIQGSVKPCKNETNSKIICKPQNIIDEKLNDVYYAFFTTDEIIDPQNFENPFQKAGRNLYGFASLNQFYHIDLYYKNMYLQDNTGLIFDHHLSNQGLSFSNEKVFSKNKAMGTGEFIKFSIRLEKVKETRIYRTYLNLAQVAANIGGILKILLIIFAISSEYLSLNQYYLDLANQVFQFDFDNDGEKNRKKQKYEQGQGYLKFKNLFGQFFSWGQNYQEKQKKKLYRIAKKQLTQNLNIQTILKTVTDVEKLKLLLLDDKQNQLFNYLPKPVISQNHLNEIQKVNQNGENKAKMKTSSYSDLKYTDDIKSSFERSQNRMESVRFNNILLIEEESSSVQKKRAFSAFRELKYKESQSHLDQKLLKLIDEDLIQQAEESMNLKGKQTKKDETIKEDGTNIVNINVSPRSYSQNDVFSRDSFVQKQYNNPNLQNSNVKIDTSQQQIQLSFSFANVKHEQQQSKQSQQSKQLQQSQQQLQNNCKRASGNFGKQDFSTSDNFEGIDQSVTDNVQDYGNQREKTRNSQLRKFIK